MQPLGLPAVASKVTVAPPQPRALRANHAEVTSGSVSYVHNSLFSEACAMPANKASPMAAEAASIVCLSRFVFIVYGWLIVVGELVGVIGCLPGGVVWCVGDKAWLSMTKCGICHKKFSTKRRRIKRSDLIVTR